MSRAWNGLQIQTRMSQELWNEATAFKERVLEWINDGIMDICSAADWIQLRREGQKVLTASQESQDLNLARPTAPTVSLLAGGNLTVGTEYKVLITYYESTAGRESIAGVASAGITPTSGNQAIALTNIPVSSDPLVDQRRVYVKVGTADYLWSSTIEDNTSTSAQVSSATITYDSATNFTYDSDKIEQSGSVFQLKDQTPTDEDLLVSFASSTTGDRSTGTKAPDAEVGSPTISGGKLDLSGGSLKYVEYNSDTFSPTTNGIFSLRMKITPNYTGSPSTNQYFWFIGDTGGTTPNSAWCRHKASGGNLEVAIYDSSGSAIGVFAAAWSPTSGTEYELTFLIDVVNGQSKVFVDSSQLGSTLTDTGTMTTAGIDTVAIGRDTGAAPSTVSDFLIRDFQLFGALVSEPQASEIPRTVNPDNYSQDLDLSVEYTVATSVRGIQDLTESITTPGSTSVQVVAKIDNDYYYWDGSAWSTSSLTFATSNTFADFNTNAGSLPLTNGAQDFYLVLILGTTDGDNTPTVTSVAIDYFSAGIPEENPSSTIEPPDYDAIFKLDGSPWIEADGTVLHHVPHRQLKRGNAVARTGTPTSWAALEPDKIALEPSPASADTLSFRYFMRPPRVYAEADSQPILPPEFRRCLEAYVIMRGYQYTKRPDDRSMKIEYEEQLAKALKRLNKKPRRIAVVRDVTGDTTGYEVT